MRLFNKLAPLAIIVTLLVVLQSCSGSDTTQPTATSAPTTVPPAAPTVAGTATATPVRGPGTITLTSTAIRGQAGKILLVLAQSEGRSQMMSRACIPIASDNFILPETRLFNLPAGGNPCADSPGITTFPEGRYLLNVGVYVGGSQTADKQFSKNVDVAGNVKVELDGAALSR